MLNSFLGETARSINDDGPDWGSSPPQQKTQQNKILLCKYLAENEIPLTLECNIKKYQSLMQHQHLVHLFYNKNW
jgi:hypothetical protein